MFPDDIDWYRVGMTAAYLALDLYMLCLWLFALRRTHLSFLRILVASNSLFVLLSVIHVAIALDEVNLKMNVFGWEAYIAFAHTLYVASPLLTIVNALGYTLLVRWLLQATCDSRATTV